MKKLWNLCNEKSITKEEKIRNFLLGEFIIDFIIGIVCWIILGRFIYSGIGGFLCFGLYPAIFIGFFGGIIYLYNHEFSN